MKRKRVCSSLSVKPSCGHEAVRCWKNKTSSSRGLKFRKMEDILRDNRSKISGINTLLGIPIPVVGAQSNLTWRLLKPHMSVENYYGTKLHSALNAIHECFEPSKDPYTNRDIAEDIVFDLESESELNLRGFYTVVLERNDHDHHEEMICAATVRIDREVAEVPLVATRPQFRRLGMCRIMMNELEKWLMEFGIEKLVLPSAQSALGTWTSNSIGFSKMTEDERSKFATCHDFLDFKDTVMCHKQLLKQPMESSSSRTKLTELAKH